MQVPSGILNPKCKCVIGHGVVAYLPGLFEEIEMLSAAGVSCEGRLMLSDRAHVLLDMHREVRSRCRGYDLLLTDVNSRLQT
jgi:adenylosuccinate synthase